MPKLVLGDNPFFAVSHLGPQKSREYLANEYRFADAAEIIRDAKHNGLDTFMISSHQETLDLLQAAGYDTALDLPDICLVVPNVHEMNAKAASNGLLGALRQRFSGSRIYDLRPKRLFQKFVMNDVVFKKSTHVALHNVVVDLLLGLRATFALRLFSRLCRSAGYKPVFITLNPIKLMIADIPCHAVCCYYNSVGYNVCDEPSNVLATAKNTKNVSEIWAMGVVASGAISYKELGNDSYLQQFDRVLIASSKNERVRDMARMISNE